MIDPDLSTRPSADHWRAARVYYDGVVNRVGAHGVTFLREARRADARELAALEDFLRRLARRLRPGVRPAADPVRRTREHPPWCPTTTDDDDGNWWPGKPPILTPDDTS